MILLFCLACLAWLGTLIDVQVSYELATSMSYPIDIFPHLSAPEFLSLFGNWWQETPIRRQSWVRSPTSTEIHGTRKNRQKSRSNWAPIYCFLFYKSRWSIGGRYVHLYMQPIKKLLHNSFGGKKTDFVSSSTTRISPIWATHCPIYSAPSPRALHSYFLPEKV